MTKEKRDFSIGHQLSARFSAKSSLRITLMLLLKYYCWVKIVLSLVFSKHFPSLYLTLFMFFFYFLLLFRQYFIYFGPNIQVNSRVHLLFTLIQMAVCAHLLHKPPNIRYVWHAPCLQESPHQHPPLSWVTEIKKNTFTFCCNK